ncbi:hypothetical protein GGX14DRAFT_640109 [Mycena pura]|uniref:Uncharacterized protein n=1 Tax=Mycena pura TaxID=153505 RepID=A0AAD7E3H5_9AGAR|nr:hypothetical protein GGX14DRAFT_640109 [Mycena pura]
MVLSKSFSNPHHFTKEADGWRCTICSDHAHHLNFRAALRHERESAEHARNVQKSEMWMWNASSQDAAAWNAPVEEDPPLTREELQMREHQYHVERVADIVPYWIKCVDAAAKGEELRLEPFLNTLQDVPASHSWMASDDPWARFAGSGWGNPGGDANRWGVHPDVQSASSPAHGSKMQTGSRTTASSVPDTGYAFVEDVARQQAVTDTDRKRRMHMFFEMSTQEKVQKIDEIVRFMRSTSV